MKAIKDLVALHTAIEDLSTIDTFSIHMPEVFYTSTLVTSIAQDSIRADKRLIVASIKLALEKEIQKILRSANDEWKSLMDNYGEYERQAP